MDHSKIYACQQSTAISPLSDEARTHAHTYQHRLKCMHTLTCSHTLTQFSKELNSQSCIDEEQQHEEQTQIPHLDRHITRTHRYIQYMIHRKKTCTVYIQRGANMQTERGTIDREALLR